MSRNRQIFLSTIAFNQRLCIVFGKELLIQTNWRLKWQTMYSPIILQYQPSLALGVTGVVIILLLTSYHILLYFRLKTWFFYLAIICTLFEIIAFAARLSWIFTGHTLLLYVSYLMVMITPSLLAAACHMTFGRIISSTISPLHQDARAFILSIRAIAPLFVTLDLITFCFYILGGTLICAAYVIDPEPIPTDPHVLGAGLQILKWCTIIQIVYLAVFAVCSLRFFTLKKCWQAYSQERKMIVLALASAVSFSSLLIMLRAIYQATQFDAAINNREAYTSKNEWVFWVNDAVPVFIILLTFAIVHPGRCLPSWVTRYHIDNSTSANIILQQDSETDLCQSARFSFQEQVYPSSPEMMLPIVPPIKAKMSPIIQVSESESPAPTSNSTRQFHEIYPYESSKAFLAFVSGHL